MEENPFWIALKSRLDWGGRRSMWQLLAATFIFPVAEAVLINLWTGAPTGQGYIPGITLAVVILVHLPFSLLIIASENSSPEKELADAVEVKAKLDRVNKELYRRTEAYKMVISAIQTFSAQSCLVTPMAALCQIVSYREGLDPVIKDLIRNANTILGVNSNQFSLEIYLQPSVNVGTSDVRGCPPVHGMHLEYFFSPQVDPCAPTRLSNNSPAHLGLAKLVPTEQHIDNDKALFYANSTPKPEVYFRRFATTSINWPCHDSSVMGLLVLTSMQDQPFAEDVLDTMRFMSTIISNFTSSYASCIQMRSIFEIPAETITQGGTGR